MSPSVRAQPLISAVLAAACGLPAPLLAKSDPVVFSFAFVGCNRMNSKDSAANPDWPSTANQPELLRTFKDVAALKPRPQLMIMAGDIVKGMKEGTGDLQVQLPAWQQLAKTGLDPKIRLVAFTGNHELLKKAARPAAPASAASSTAAAAASDDEDDVEVPNPPAYAYWQATMTPYIAGSDGPRKGGKDGLVGDETQLSYTFQMGNVRFIVLNTDSLRDETSIGVVPMDWLRQQLTAAQADSSVAHVFVMGHKPAALPWSKTPVDPSGANTIRQEQAGDFYQLLNAPGGGATKVRAYLAAHAHLWNDMKQPPAELGKGKVRQIIAGNGGSPPEKAWKTGGDYFGYTLVQITSSGQVQAVNYGRKIHGKTGVSKKHKPEPATQRGKVIELPS